MTDDCNKLKPALSQVFPEVQQQICLWHIPKNVVQNVKEKWVSQPIGASAAVSSRPMESRISQLTVQIRRESDDTTSPPNRRRYEYSMDGLVEM